MFSPLLQATQALRVSRGIALGPLALDGGQPDALVASTTPQKDLLPIVQRAGWAPGPVWTGGKSCPHRDSIPDRPAHSQMLYQLSYLEYDEIYVGN